MKNMSSVIKSGLIAVVLIGLLSLGAWLLYRIGPTSAVAITPSIAESQSGLEQSFTTVDASFDSPQVIVNPYKISPLTALVNFRTEKPVSVTVTIPGKDPLTTYTHEFPEAIEHRLPIYGLYPGQENLVTLQAGDRSVVIPITPDPLPKNIPKSLNVTKRNELLTNDLYFMTPSSPHARTMAFDVNGDVRWWLDGRYSWEIKRLQNGRLMLGSGKLIADPYYLASMYEMDLLGKVYKEYRTPGYHHDYHERKNGNLIVAVNNLEREKGTTIEDTVIEIDRTTGHIEKTIDLTELLPQDVGKSLDWSESDWFHNNSVYLNEETDELILSGRHQDAVVNIDYSSGTLNYIIGSPDTWPEDMKQYFLTPVGDPFEWQWEQHAASFIPNGDIILFDNGTHRSKHKDTAVSASQNYSRAVMYRVNKEARTIEQIWEYGKARGHEYFSPYISDADYLGDNHTLVHSGGVSYKDGYVQNLPASLSGADTLRSFTTEVIDDQVAFELQTDTHFYRAEKMPLYYEKEASATLGGTSTVGRTPQSPAQRWILPDYAITLPDKTYADADISLTKADGQLVIKGTFHENDVVQLVLSNRNDTWRHRVPMKSEVFSNAACIDVFDTSLPKGDEVTVNHSFSGAYGTYAIFLQINGTLYRTGQHIGWS